MADPPSPTSPPPPSLPSLSLSELETALRGQNPKDLTPNVQTLVVNNISLVLDSAFRTQLSCSYSTSYTCSGILKSATSHFLFRILRSPEFSNYLVRFLQNLPSYRIESQTLFFTHFLLLIDHSNGEFWQIVPPIQIQHFLINSIYLDSVFSFLQSFLSKNFDFSKFSFPQELSQQIVSQDRNLIQTLQLIKSLLDSPGISAEIAAALSPHIDQISIESFRQKNLRQLDFLITLYTKANSSPHIPSWVRIRDSIAFCYPRICEILINMNSFSQFESSISKLFLLISPDRVCLHEMASKVVQHAFQLLFKFPTNSFLHNFVIASMEMLVERRTFVKEVIEQGNIVDQIIVNYGGSQLEGKSFGGHLRVLSNLIEPFVNRGKYPDWDGIVMKGNKRKEKLIHQNDGKGIWMTKWTFVKLLESPETGMIVVWMAAIFFILFIYTVVYVSCAI
jgi:hypothetical protein